MESAKEKAEREERERLQRIEKELEEKRIREEIIARENILRVDQLIESGNVIKSYESSGAETEDSSFEREIQIECRNIPDTAKLNTVNSFYVEWVNLILDGQVRLDIVFQHSPIILQLIDEMQEFLQLPPSTSTIQSLCEMGLIYHDFCETQQKFLNEGSYNIMIDLRDLFDPEVGVFENSLSTKEIVHSLWGNLFSRPEYRGHIFESLNFRFTLPDSLVMVKGIYRLLKTKYDHYSQSSNSFYPPNVLNFHQTSIKNWTTRKLIFAVICVDDIFEAPQREKEKDSLNKGALEIKKDESSSAKSEPGPGPKLPAQETRKSTQHMTDNESKSSATGAVDEMDVGEKEKESGVSEPEPKEDDEQPESEVILVVTDAENVEKKFTSEVDVSAAQAMESKISMSEEGTDIKDRAVPKSTPTTATSSKKSKKTKAKPVVVQETRSKTEAELAKERERSEKANFLPRLVHKNELNLRNYVILAGVYNFKLFEIPPQPVSRGRNAWTLHQIEAEQRLKEIEFTADFIAPPSADMSSIRKTPEEMEREAKRQEEELQKLVLLEIKVPKIALWFDPPTPVRWVHDQRIWSTDGFHDVRFSEYSLQLSFRTARFGIIGLAHNRWSNLPYQSWEIKPSGPNCATFNLLAAMAVVEFTNDLVCVSSLQNVGNSDEVEKAVVNQYMKPRELIKALRSHGLDVFPDFDSYAYVDGVLIKEAKTEDHLYQCMALASRAFNFHWSRWNLLAGREKMIYQMRERLGTSTPGNYQMVLNTPRSAMLIDCTEVSPTYSEEPVENYRYHADLLQLLTYQIASAEGKEVITSTSGQFVETMRSLLSSVRPLSFS